MPSQIVSRPSQPARFPNVDIRGLPVAACRTAEVEGLIADAVEHDLLCRIATINLDFLRLADERPEVMEALLACEHRVADGWPILELAELAGHPLPERVTGADLVPRILVWAANRGWRIAMVGGMEETREALAAQPGWNKIVCGHWMPYYKGLEVRDESLCAEIRASGANIIFVALGCPKQEIWINQNLDDSGAQCALGIGASLEFLAGIKSRAPGFVQKLNLEFAYRLLCEPRRLGGRYLKDYLFWRRARRQAEVAARRRSSSN